MLLKKTIIATILNLFFGGIGYLYIREKSRIPLAIFLIFATIYEYIRNLAHPNLGLQGNPFAITPMLSLLGGFFGILLLTIMTIDIYFLVKRQAARDAGLRQQKVIIKK